MFIMYVNEDTISHSDNYKLHR